MAVPGFVLGAHYARTATHGNPSRDECWLDGAGSETISGALTLVIRAGGAGLLRCNGTAWFAISLSAMDITGLTVKTTPVPGADYAPIYDAAGSANKKMLVEKLGRVVQRVYDEERAYSNNSGYTAIPADDTKPEITEGLGILSVTITPFSASNRIRARAIVPYGHGNGGTLVLSIHRGGQALASSWSYGAAANERAVGVVEFEETAPGTSAVTYSARFGGYGSASAFQISGDGGGGGSKLGGALVCSLVVEEIVP